MSDVKELIRNLLAKAESTTPHEAEALTTAAEKLMIKHGIERAHIEAKETTAKVISEKIAYEGMWQTAKANGFGQVVMALGLRPFVSKRNGKTFLWIVGFESDVADAIILIRSLEQQGEIALAAWWKQARPILKRYNYTNHMLHVERRSYVEAFGSGAAARIVNERAEAMAKAGSGTDLVLASRDAEIDLYVDIAIQPTKPTKPRRKLGVYGTSDGYVTGQQADLNTNVFDSADSDKPAIR